MNEIHSETKRLAVLRWYDEVMSTRVNDQRTCTWVLIMQRGHEQDLCGHLIAQGGWTLLKLPMEFNPAKRCSTPFFTDPRTAPGELLFPHRYTAEIVVREKEKMGPW